MGAARSFERESRSARFYRSEGDLNLAAFELHKSVESAYSALLLTLTNSSPPSHNLTFLRGLAEDQDRRLVEAWPRDQRRHMAWYKRPILACKLA
ncbi:HEPN domain-containing protein [Sinorhizobium meliloti]|nr:HEPN domain-containing protein [Sinorhizobium meliloti]